jgi:imidazolonepropionase-like amidohydrolase
MKTQELCDLPAFANDPDLRYMAPNTVSDWKKAAHDFRKFSAQQRDTFSAYFALQLKLVKIFDEEGAPLLAGTDCVGAAWVVAGSSLHREFDELTTAGLTPLRVLQLATLDPARFLGIDSEGSGVVAVGSPADLLIVETDPLIASTNLRGIAGVVRAGVHTDATELAAIKEGVSSRGLS